MEEGSAASRLRLSSAKRRIAAFIEQIDILAASSFPHDDGKKALAAIRVHCKGLQADLDLPPGIRADVIDQLCLTLLDKVDNFTAILGFILRSTNVRNPFELHYAVKELIIRTLGELPLGEEVSLLISSEWSYVPFTYPMNADQLPGSILIGTPAPESGNPLLIPLAGHEVGHSAWRVYAFGPRYSLMVSDAVEHALKQNVKAMQELQTAQPLGALDKERIIDQCADHVMQQLEEVFCDLFGLFLFGPAFVAAFDYLLGPGGHDRTLDYPSDRQRMAFLVAAANDRGIELDQEMVAVWTEALPLKADRAEAEIIDAVMSELVPRMQKDLFDKINRSGFKPPRSDVIDKVLDAYCRGEPYPNRVELGESVSAGWKRLRQLDVAEFKGRDDEEKERNRAKSYKVLADLVLKTVEVAEYHDRVDGHA
ncbi:hypothetical protein U1839_26380 [Sphingomonas sp. RT2P30]|uniref:hypothetical protein n=1 Tax=Parasphingomonas halimpatiens TaxID=3096162 RepID=UPI002FC8FA40